MPCPSLSVSTASVAPSSERNAAGARKASVVRPGIGASLSFDDRLRFDLSDSTRHGCSHRYELD
jgi:hypothetical protein